MDEFIRDKQNKLNALDFSVGVNLHQIFHMRLNLDEAIITTKGTIKKLKDRIPELRREKQEQKKEVADTRKQFYHLQNSKHKFLARSVVDNAHSLENNFILCLHLVSLVLEVCLLNISQLPY